MGILYTKTYSYETFSIANNAYNGVLERGTPSNLIELINHSTLAN